MATQEQYPNVQDGEDNEGGAVQAQIPHSNVYHDEPPFDASHPISLAEADTRGLIETPTSPAPLMPPVEKEAPRRGWRRTTAAGVLGLTVVAGALGVGEAVGGDDTNTEPRVEPSVGAPANPGETQNTPEVNSGPRVLSPELLNNPEALAEAYVEQEEAWTHAGKDKLPTSLDNYDPNVQETDYVLDAIGDSDKQFVDKLFADDWQTNSSLTELVNTVERLHSVELTLYFHTIPELTQDPANIEAFNSTKEVTAVRTIASSDNSTTIEYDYVRHTNGSLSRAPEYMADGDFDGVTGTIQLTFSDVGGKLKVTDQNTSN